MADAVVGDAEDAQAVGRDAGVALGVVLLLLVMDAAVDLDDEGNGVTVEVDDEAGDDLLAAEGVATVAQETQLLSEGTLFGCHLAAQRFSSFDLDGAGAGVARGMVHGSSPPDPLSP